MMVLVIYIQQMHIIHKVQQMLHHLIIMLVIYFMIKVAVITETGSWSGSVDYSDLATNYTFKIWFTTYNTTHEYNVTLLPQDYNLTMNYSIRNVLSGSSEPLTLGTQYLAHHLQVVIFNHTLQQLIYIKMVIMIHLYSSCFTKTNKKKW